MGVSIAVILFLSFHLDLTCLVSWALILMLELGETLGNLNVNHWAQRQDHGTIICTIMAPPKSCLPGFMPLYNVTLLLLPSRGLCPHSVDMAWLYNLLWPMEISLRNMVQLWRLRLRGFRASAFVDLNVWEQMRKPSTEDHERERLSYLSHPSWAHAPVGLPVIMVVWVG